MVAAYSGAWGERQRYAFFMAMGAGIQEAVAYLAFWDLILSQLTQVFNFDEADSDIRDDVAAMLTGEAEPGRKYGLNVTARGVDERLLKFHGVQHPTEWQKVMARLELILDQVMHL